MRIARRVCVAASVVLVSAATACVEPFDGSNVQLDFAGGVQTNPRGSEVVADDQPPLNTHYVLYGVDLVYQLGPDGQPVLGTDGEPIVERTYQYEVKAFQIRPVIDTGSPCLIDLEGSRFPGIHVTQYAAAVRAATGITDPFAPGQDAGDVSDVLTADRRMSNLTLIQGMLKAVVSYADYRYPAPDAVCADDPASNAQLVPPPTCIDAASNARRLTLCQAAWKANPDFYEGSDKVFTLPLGGAFYGMVEGTNPTNGGFVGGASFFVDSNLRNLEAYLINWQYDDLDHDGAPDFPASLPADQRSVTGFPYMRGTPAGVARGVITVPLHHPRNGRIAATMAIFPDLGTDGVHF
ncbi:MAG: hypothetical protein R3B06_16255 [Kofleriaceae bacterium]